ncbi:hypothetical protein L226DRAFT_575970 [Lentinus tigrinus ALCF2SS1-7]|uniref:Bromo domain-containing protein n=1 Tax=Lentinus tigrinus ALCF2SS1-6 TaxID=1328759 RepID=A0A5C2S2Y5_9APHY|nr:hypothetical protein L227DRAFT_655125 [Lentinus tigrinus ALCF2SS1-6]RPD69048.1 hypothetical protein L226DRAFT_575970 [Lentinus tigrinus ALCF2SS1-7]
MNNLLRTLTASRVKSSLPESELKLLLSAVKETRRSSNDPAKLADAFYDSLEGLLHDLRMVTMDNRDAEAFLKPVAKSEVPDYYDIISNPMDLQTMLKKVKQRHYKSKKEFKDDLALIWSNCFTYNATEDHPLRQCATRLKAKAERLLKNITDYKERADPVIPGEVPVRGMTPRMNGVTLNGTSRHHSTFRSPSPTKPTIVLPGQSKKIQRDTTFAESSALLRSQTGMTAFLELERDVDDYLAREDSLDASDPGVQQLKQRLLRYASPDEDGDGSLSVDASTSSFDGDIGAKRKLNGYSDDRPRKRARMQGSPDKAVVELWWDAVRSDELVANGVPNLTKNSSEITAPAPPSTILDPPRQSTRRRKKRKEVSSPNTLLYHMNNNIRTLRRVRTTHAKLSAVAQSLEESGGVIQPPVPDAAEELDDVLDERPWKPIGAGIDMGEENANDCLHWMGSKVLEHAGFQGTSKMALDVLSSVAAEYLFNVGRTIRFLCDKYGNEMTAEEIILHTLFESGITRINDLERYIKDDVVRYGGRLSELEKKLANAYREATTVEAWDDEALFRMDDEEEEGEFVMGNFADSFGDDFFGLKELGIADEFGLSSLTVPKRLLKGKAKGGIKEDPEAAKPKEPPPPFPPPPPFIPLDSTTVDNQIGLLKPFYQTRISEISTSLLAPPAAGLPPTSGLPPPLPGVTSLGVLPPIPSLPPVPTNPTAAGHALMPPGASVPAPAPELPSVIVLPDDAPSPSHAKIGPLGTVNKATPAANAAKKKSKAKPPAPGPSGAGGMDGDVPPATPGPPPSLSLMASSSTGGEPKKGKGAGTPSKKKAKVEPFPPVVMASA